MLEISLAGKAEGEGRGQRLKDWFRALALAFSLSFLQITFSSYSRMLEQQYLDEFVFDGVKGSLGAVSDVEFI